MITTTLLRALRMEKELAASKCEFNEEYCRLECRRD